MGRLNAIYIVLFGGVFVRIGTLLAVLYMGPDHALASSDSLGFYEDALYVAQSGDYFPFSIGWQPYVNVIGYLMYRFGESISMMFLLSILAWLLSAIIIDKSLCILDAKHNTRLFVALCMAFFPSLLFSTSIPMREAFQILGMTLVTFSTIKIIYQDNFSHILVFLIGASIASSLHISLFVSSIIFTVCIFLGYKFRHRKLTATQIIFSIFLTVLITIFIVGFVQDQHQGNAEDIFGTVESFRDNGASLDARAQYKEQDASGVVGDGGVIGLIIGFIQYMVEPLPWRISSVGDLIVIAENVLRVTLVVLIARKSRSTPHSEFALAITLLAMFFFAEFIWSTGTINWGTAARHHVPSMPFLLAACFVLRRKLASKGTMRAPLPAA